MARSMCELMSFLNNVIAMVANAAGAASDTARRCWQREYEWVETEPACAAIVPRQNRI